jgi:hypothetical protein
MRELNAKSRSLFLGFEFAPQQSQKKKSSARRFLREREREDANKGHCVRVYLTIFGHQQERLLPPSPPLLASFRSRRHYFIRRATRYFSIAAVEAEVWKLGRNIGAEPAAASL